jgi:G:T-mismatch repair DNA endonuclease (very short patch repair protein)
MTDVFSIEKRSWVMSRIRSKNTKIEVIMKELFVRNKMNFEMHPKVSALLIFSLEKIRLSFVMVIFGMVMITGMEEFQDKNFGVIK